MKGLLEGPWLWFCNLLRSSPSPQTRTSLKDKATAVAGRVTITNDKELSKVSCPVCFSVMQSKFDSDLRKILAVHLNLWHPDDVELQWEIMQRKELSIVHLPSIILGVGMAAGLGSLLVLAAKNQPRDLPVRRRR